MTLCEYCRATTASAARFCPSCGKLIEHRQSEVLHSHDIDSTNQNSNKSIIPDAKLLYISRKIWIAFAFKSKDALAQDWSWNKLSDVLVTDKYVALTGAPELSSVTNMAYGSANKLTGELGRIPALLFLGAAGTAFATSVAEAIGDAYENKYGKNNEFSSISLDALFNAGKMIFCQYKGLQGGYVTHKKLFLPDEKYYFLFGAFSHMSGIIEVKFYLVGKHRERENQTQLKSCVKQALCLMIADQSTIRWVC